MITDSTLSLKTALYLFINKGFTKCEVWDEYDYIITHHNRRLTSHLIAARKIDMLISKGVPQEKAVTIVSIAGMQKLTKSNLGLLGSPIAVGTVEKLINDINDTRLWNKMVTDIEFRGFRRTKLILLVNKEEASLQYQVIE